jgi:hypothetical protein
MYLLRIFTVLLLIVSGVYTVYAQDPGTTSAHLERVDLSKSVHIFPNPSVEYVHVRIEQVDVAELKLSLHNIIGNEMSVETEVVDEHELRIRVKDLDAGYYLIALRNDKIHFRGTYKFLKK